VADGRRPARAMGRGEGGLLSPLVRRYDAAEVCSRLTGSNVERMLKFLEEIEAYPTQVRLSSFGYAAVCQDLLALTRYTPDDVQGPDEPEPGRMRPCTKPIYVTLRRRNGTQTKFVEDQTLQPGDFELDLLEDA
jgi:hypothetical protein